MNHKNKMIWFIVTKLAIRTVRYQQNNYFLKQVWLFEIKILKRLKNALAYYLK
jgi:hypothetical protein